MDRRPARRHARVPRTRAYRLGRARRPPEVYVHAGGQYEWDSCAPAAVALASGLHASRLDGSPLRYGDPDAWLPDLVVCRPEYASAVLDVTTRQRRPYW